MPKRRKISELIDFVNHTPGHIAVDQNNVQGVVEPHLVNSRDWGGVFEKNDHQTQMQANHNKHLGREKAREFADIPNQANKSN